MRSQWITIQCHFRMLVSSEEREQLMLSKLLKEPNEKTQTANRFQWIRMASPRNKTHRVSQLSGVPFSRQVLLFLPKTGPHSYYSSKLTTLLSVRRTGPRADCWGLLAASLIGVSRLCVSLADGRRRDTEPESTLFHV